MKKITFLVFIGLFAMGCVKSRQNIDTETLMVMHKLIERSHPDTVNKYLTYYALQYDLPSGFKTLADGHYKGSSPYDDFKYKHIVNFTIKDGLLSEIEYDEVHEDGHSKKSDSSYNAQMNENVYGSAPAVTYDEYEKRLKDKQGFEGVDAISGATYSLYRLKYAFWRAVLNGPAKKG